jgi:hypothetical protein
VEFDKFKVKMSENCERDVKVGQAAKMQNVIMKIRV